MNIEHLYKTALGRSFVKIMQKAGLFRLTSWYLKTKPSKLMINRYIKKNEIDMTPFQNQRYNCFADFFARQRSDIVFNNNKDCFCSPCDGLLTIYPVTDELIIPMKGSWYMLDDLIPDTDLAWKYTNGLCCVFRLQAKDYHHFYTFDDMSVEKTVYIPGFLHSVQPCACNKVQVYRQNRRWYSVLNTQNFGKVIQIEVGAMLVGGVSFCNTEAKLTRGDKMGNFELAGSTIVVFFDQYTKNKLFFYDEYQKAIGGSTEIPVSVGKPIGILK